MATDQIILVNQRAAPFLATEYHDIVCRRRDRCDCAVKESLGPDNKPRFKKLPKSFHIEAKSKSRPLDRAVLFIPQVRDALKASPPWLKVEEIPKPEKKATPKASKSKASKAKTEPSTEA